MLAPFFLQYLHKRIYMLLSPILKMCGCENLQICRRQQNKGQDLTKIFICCFVVNSIQISKLDIVLYFGSHLH